MGKASLQTLRANAARAVMITESHIVMGVRHQRMQPDVQRLQTVA